MIDKTDKKRLSDEELKIQLEFLKCEQKRRTDDKYNTMLKSIVKTDEDVELWNECEMKTFMEDLD